MDVCVKKGKQDFKPLGIAPFEIPWILPSRMIFKWKFSFNDSCIYSNQNDDDLRSDLNKGGGISMWLRKNNHNAALWSWRPSMDGHTIEVGPYFNKTGGIVFPEPGNFLKFRPSEEGMVTIWRKKKVWYVQIEHLITGHSVIQSEQITRPWFVKRVGAWFGGRDNDGNGIGGVAPQAMCFFSRFYI